MMTTWLKQSIRVVIEALVEYGTQLGQTEPALCDRRPNYDDGNSSKHMLRTTVASGCLLSSRSVPRHRCCVLLG